MNTRNYPIGKIIFLFIGCAFAWACIQLLLVLYSPETLIEKKQILIVQNNQPEIYMDKENRPSDLINSGLHTGDSIQSIAQFKESGYRNNIYYLISQGDRKFWIKNKDAITLREFSVQNRKTEFNSRIPLRLLKARAVNYAATKGVVLSCSTDTSVGNLCKEPAFTSQRVHISLYPIADTITHVKMYWMQKTFNLNHFMQEAAEYMETGKK
jgi:hypothetical protein